jgi:hypothetical protein
VSEAEELLSFGQRMNRNGRVGGAVTWTCVCWSFKTRGECSHIVAAQMLAEVEYRS